MILTYHTSCAVVSFFCYGGKWFLVAQVSFLVVAGNRFRCYFLTYLTLELYPDSVFRYGIGWYFIGIFLTDTEGKLGKDLRHRTFGGNPFFARFCPLFDGPSPPFEGNSSKISQNGAPAKSYSTKNTVHTIPNIPTGKCR